MRGQKVPFYGFLFLVILSLVFAIDKTVEADHVGSEANPYLTLSDTFVEIAERVTPAVVHIQVTKEIQAPSIGHPDIFDDFFRDFFPHSPFERRSPRLRKKNSPQKKYKQEGMGSGVIVSADGYILSNNHVVQEASEITVTLKDKRTFKGKVIGTDPKTDLAVLKIEGSDFPYVFLGDSDQLKVGEWVLAIGNPFGLSQTVTSGIISAKGRANVGIVDYEDFIQTDAAINPGNSGGPLINLRGEIVGINTAILSKSGGYQGIGFSIPVNMANKIMQQLIDTGTVQRGWLGVQIREVSPELAEAFNFPKNQGALVEDLSKEGPAYKAGLRSGDIIVSFNGKPVDSVNTLRNLVAGTSAGVKTAIVVFRDGKYQTFYVQIGDLSQAAWGKLSTDTNEEETFDEWGLNLQELTPQLAEKYNIDRNLGVVISSIKPESLAAQARLQEGDLILAINHRPIQAFQDAKKIMSEDKDKEAFLFKVLTKGRVRYVILKK